MDTEFIDEINQPKKKGSGVTKNVLISVAIILAICLIIFFGIGESGGMYAYLAALLLAIIAFPSLSILTGIGFFIAGKKSEGGIMLIIGFSFLLFGLIVCGGVLR